MGNLTEFLGDFDTNEVEPLGDFSPIPEGDYQVMIEDAEIVGNNAGTGKNIKLAMLVVEGEFVGRKVWRYVTLRGSEKGEKFGKAELSSICAAVGFAGKFTDTDQICMKPMWVFIKVEARQDKPGEFSNVVKRYHPHGYKPNAAQAAPATKPAAAQTAPATSTGNPFGRKQ